MKAKVVAGKNCVELEDELNKWLNEIEAQGGTVVDIKFTTAFYNSNLFGDGFNYSAIIMYNDAMNMFAVEGADTR